jgi:hypothetical protein
MIHAEVVETRVQQHYDYGLETTFSDDLFAAVADGLLPDIPVGPGFAENKSLPNLGFSNFYHEFPIVDAGSAGISVDYLTKHARFLFSAAMSDAETRVLSQPRILVQNNDQATLTVGGSKAFRTSTVYTTSDNLRDNTQSSRPTGSHDDVCELDILLSNKDAFPAEGSSPDDPLIDTTEQNFESLMRVPSGETLVLGGLVTRNKTATKSGVPLLYRIPFLGALLFGSKTNDDTQRNLLIFITPVVLKEEPRQRTPAVPIDEAVAMLAKERGEEPAQAPEEPDRRLYQRLEDLLVGLQEAGEGATTDSRALEPTLPPAVPAATPLTTGPLTAPQLPGLPEDALPGPPTAGPSPVGAPLTSEPLPRADLERAPVETTTDGPPQTSYVYQPSGAFGNITDQGRTPSSGGSGAAAAASGRAAQPVSRAPAPGAADRRPTTVRPTPRPPRGRPTAETSY